MKNNSVAIVTGASQGIGRATAVRLARDFSAVVLIARNQNELQKTSGAVAAAGAESLVYALDLREPESGETIVNGTLERFGRIDAVLNIAGAVPQIDLFEMTDAQWQDGMAFKIPWRASSHDTRLGRIEGFEWFGRSDFRKRRSRPQAWVRGGCSDKSCHYRVGKGIRRTRHQGRRASE